MEGQALPCIDFNGKQQRLTFGFIGKGLSAGNMCHKAGDQEDGAFHGLMVSTHWIRLHYSETRLPPRHLAMQVKSSDTEQVPL